MSTQTDLVPNQNVIALYDTRAREIAAAQRYVRASVFGVVASALTTISDHAINTTAAPTSGSLSRTITLELTVTPPKTSASSGVLPTGSTGAGGLKVITTVTAKANLSKKAVLTFDVGPGVDGYAQRIDITSNARQSYHNTALGFYVDEWNEAMGQLSIDVLVPYKDLPGNQVQAFFDLLNKAKQTTPYSNAPPAVLRYHDNYLQRSYVITQDNVRLQESVERPNMAQFTITAEILFDYGNTTTLPALRTASPLAISAAANAISSGTIIAP